MKIFAFLSLLVCQSFAAIKLKPLSYTKIPYQYVNGNLSAPVYGLFTDAAYQAAYHTVDRILYIASGNERKLVHLVDMDNPYNPRVVYAHEFKEFSDGIITDIEACPDTIAITLTKKGNISEGHVEFFTPYNRADKVFTMLGRVTVGSYPKSMKFSSDCTRLVVVSEGMPGFDGGQFFDPEGQINILVRNDQGFVVNIPMDMSQFNDNALDYMIKGIRYVYRGDHQANIRNTFSQDLEPESVTISNDDRFAYVSLQENNAVLKIDLTLYKLIDIYPLGSKQWRNFDIDASDVNGAKLERHNIYSLNQPGELTYFNTSAGSFLISADTGKMKVLDNLNFTDGERCKNGLAEGLIDPLIDPSLLSKLSDPAMLGNVYMSTEDGKNFLDYVENVHIFGGRGISLWDPTTMKKVFDSGDDLERHAFMEYPGTFNGDCSNSAMTPGQEADQLSDEMGPEPTSLAVGNLNKTNPVVVVGTKSGMVFIFSLRGSSATYESVHRSGDTTDSWQTLYNIGRAGDGTISDVGFIEADKSGTRTDLLYVVGEATGSLSIYEFINA